MARRWAIILAACGTVNAGMAVVNLCFGKPWLALFSGALSVICLLQAAWWAKEYRRLGRGLG